MLIQILVLVWAMLFTPVTNVAPVASTEHYDCDEYWIDSALLEGRSEADIMQSALDEFDAIYASIETKVRIITRADLKRQIIIRRDNKFVGGKVIGYATAYDFMEAFSV